MCGILAAGMFFLRITSFQFMLTKLATHCRRHPAHQSPSHFSPNQSLLVICAQFPGNTPFS
jgi:hypothetical protein